MNRYAARKRTRQTFTLTGVEHRGGRDGNERLVCFVKGESGLLAVWGQARVDMAHIHEVERRGFPLTVECDWIEPDEYEARNFNHRYWVPESEHFVIK